MDEGLLEPGNIDYKTRPIVKNPDGSISTVRGSSFDLPDGRAVLLPIIADDGRQLNSKEAFAQYKNTGKHLGIFTDHESADAYSRAHHSDMAPDAVRNRPNFNFADLIKPPEQQIPLR